MTHTTKWIVGVLIVVGFMGIVCIAAVVGLVYYVSRGEKTAEYQAKQIEGREFGKTADQTGCLKEGLQRSKGIRLLDIHGSMSNEAFVGECLKSASPTPGFCDGVPPVLKFQDSEWERKQCEKSGLDEVQTSCTTVFHVKLEFCRHLK